MSLMSRARAAEGAGPSREPSNGLETLKAQVLSLVSADDIAAMVTANPNRARSELRSACRQAFEDVSWSAVPREERRRLVCELVDAVLGFGPLEGLLADDSVTEIMVNGPCDVFFEREGRLFRSEARFADEAQLRALIDRMLGPLGRRVDEASPMANARLPQGYRVHVVIPPLALDGPVLTIRKFASRVMTLEDMMRAGSFGSTVGRCLAWAVRARKNIAVSGGTGSGKTTLLNALSCALPRDERIVTIEDSAELRFLEHPHVVRLEARPRSAEGTGEVTIRDLVINALRMRPDRIVVGECRGAEALDMLQAMNTGHDGSLTTLHANSPSDVVSRLTTMVRYAAELPVDVIESSIASAFDAVVQTARSLDGARYVSEVAELSYNRERHVCQVKTLYRRDRSETEGRWRAEPFWIGELPALRVANEEEVAAWRRACCSAA
ncbi:secretion system protein E [Gordonibacter sp. An230]|uniref:CpaF family protein n=1 Tax=Gordonibacter sp. An230 TaxID=1965592 RepID=UPI000B36C146|nr:CpaF family protein [Gordonibacter sp. An230]OUO92132.1 secretion system protein E [Gordonibacter sp. An230]